MVNPGSFQGLRKKFLDDQQEFYAAAVRDKHIADAVADIQRRYFKRFPLTLSHTQEPSEEFLATVDDDAPDPELLPPQKGTLSDEAYARDCRVYEFQVAELKMRQAQIKRRLHYQYTRAQGKKTTFEMGTDDPLAILMTKLTGGTVQKPRQKTPYNLWGPANRVFIDPIFSERVREGNVPAKQQAALRSALYKELFEELPEEERQEWAEKAELEHKEALSKVNNTLKSGASFAPADRQRVIEGLTNFAQPILDLISEHTGWAVTLVAGGPEPADAGRLNTLSLHAGTTSGIVKMNFGRAERAGYRDYVLPLFGKFLRKCYSVQECRELALPEKNGFAGLFAASAQDGVEVFTFDDGKRKAGNNYIHIPALRQSTSTTLSSNSGSVANASSTSRTKTIPIKIGPPKASKKQKSDTQISTRSISSKNHVAADKSNNANTPNIAFASRSPGPSPLVSRAPTPEPTAPSTETATDVLRPATPVVTPSSIASTVSAGGVVDERAQADILAAPLATPVQEIGTPISSIALGDIAANIVNPVPSDVNSTSVEDRTVPHSAPRASSVDVIASRCGASDTLSAAPVEATTASRVAPPPAIPCTPSEAIITPRRATSVEPSIPRALSDIASSFPAAAQVIATPAVPCASSAVEHSVPHFVPTAPRALSAELPSRPTEMVNTRSSAGCLASGSISVPSMQQLADAENEKRSRKRKGGSANAASDQKKRKTSVQGVASASTSCDSMDVDNPSHPNWVSRALELFRSAKLGSEWNSLVVKWLLFEEKSGYKGAMNLGTQHRPRVISNWIQRARSPKYYPEIKDVEAFGIAMTAWWRGLQPDWRADDIQNGVLRREGGTWEDIRRPGVNGLLSVMAGLFFWGSAAQNTPKLNAWLEVLDDVNHVFDQLA